MSTLKSVLSDLKRERWDSLKDVVNNGPAETAYETIKMAVDKLGFDIRLTAAVSHEDDLAGLIAKGGVAYFLASKARAGALPTRMSEGQVDSYFTGLTIARQCLDRALVLAPKSGLAAALAMGCAIDPMDETHKPTAEAALLAADDVPMSGYMNLMMALAAKWGGSHDDMFRVARSRQDVGRPGSAALLARAHFERRLFYSAFDESPQAAARAAGYYHDLDVRQDLEDASARALKLQGDDPAEQRLAHGWLAFVLFDAEMYRTSVKHLDRLKGFVDPGIWRILSLPPFAVKALIRLSAR